MLAFCLEIAMADLTIRNLDDDVYERLKARAKLNERSLEGEVRAILRGVVRPDRAEFIKWLEEFRGKQKPLRAGTTTRWIREDRDR
jgi:plasmid stability protein